MRRTAQQMRLGKAAKACRGRKGRSFRACVSAKLRHRRR